MNIRLATWVPVSRAPTVVWFTPGMSAAVWGVVRQDEHTKTGKVTLLAQAPRTSVLRPGANVGSRFASGSPPPTNKCFETGTANLWGSLPHQAQVFRLQHLLYLPPKAIVMRPCFVNHHLGSPLFGQTPEHSPCRNRKFEQCNESCTPGVLSSCPRSLGVLGSRAGQLL